eukprot:GFKZ01004690.1.p1 GENE.GFKZ01004690.1~~GFKZ01004690.1.p1  ORF type:complete len:394 (-),score=30.51 GFKZ01004690.1:2608-3789(-)
MNRRKRLALQILITLALFALFERVPPYDAARFRLLSSPPHVCTLTRVQSLPPSACTLPGFLPDPVPLPLAAPCRWHLTTVTDLAPTYTPLRLLSPSNHVFSSQQLSLLRQLDGCNSSVTCQNQTVQCAFTAKIPSDVLWVHNYNNGSKFVIIFRITLISLFLYLFAIICEGSIFYPHRPGSVSISTAYILGIIACAALLYLLVVPRKWQLSLYGAGFLQTFAYLLLILTIAGALPGLTVTWVSFFLFAIYFLGFALEQLLCMIAGILHYLGALSLYQAENTFFHLRLMYYPDVLDEVELDRHLLEMSQRFLERVRGNVFLYRIPTALEQDGLQVVGSTLPDHLFDDMVADNIPQVDFESIATHSEEPSSLSDSPTEPMPNQTTPLLQRGGSPT